MGSGLGGGHRSEGMWEVGPSRDSEQAPGRGSQGAGPAQVCSCGVGLGVGGWPLQVGCLREVGEWRGSLDSG